MTSASRFKSGYFYSCPCTVLLSLVKYILIHPVAVCATFLVLRMIMTPHYANWSKATRSHCSPCSSVLLLWVSLLIKRQTSSSSSPCDSHILPIRLRGGVARRSPVQCLQVVLLWPAINYHSLITPHCPWHLSSQLAGLGHATHWHFAVRTSQVQEATTVHWATTLRCECTNKIRLYAITSNPERTGIQNKPDLDGT